MPDYVVRNDNSAILPFVLGVPDGISDADLQQRVAAYGPTWHLDSDATPTDVAAQVDAAALALANKPTDQPTDQPAAPSPSPQPQPGVPAQN